MKIVLVFTGKTDENYLKEGIDKFVRRLKHYIPLEIKITGESGRKSRTRAFSPGTNSFTVLLDEKGEKMSSRDLAIFMEKIMNQGHKELVFITGGAYGFSEGSYPAADKVISLSDMTFSHQMVRLILIEQIYRAMTIIRGEPYHHQ